MNRRLPKPRQPKAPWVRAFPRQESALRPEAGAAGGVKERSGSEAARMAVYAAISRLFLQWYWRDSRPCDGCIARSLPSAPNPPEHVHHTKGRAGLLLFDVRFFKAVCAECHRFIGDNPAEARRLGLLCAEGEWCKVLKESDKNTCKSP